MSLHQVSHYLYSKRAASHRFGEIKKAVLGLTASAHWIPLGSKWLCVVAVLVYVSELILPIFTFITVVFRIAIKEHFTKFRDIDMDWASLTGSATSLAWYWAVWLCPIQICGYTLCAKSLVLVDIQTNIGLYRDMVYIFGH